MRTDRETNMTKLIVAVRNFANTPKNLTDCSAIRPRCSPQYEGESTLIGHSELISGRHNQHTSSNRVHLEQVIDDQLANNFLSFFSNMENATASCHFTDPESVEYSRNLFRSMNHFRLSVPFCWLSRKVSSIHFLRLYFCT
jgi:hypothetical protein